MIVPFLPVLEEVRGGEESMCAPTSRQRVKTEERFTWRTVSQSDVGNWWAG